MTHHDQVESILIKIARKRVNCFLLGFPKCGTTSLMAWLATSPDISTSLPKETYAFCPEAGRPPLNFRFSSTKSKVFIEGTTLNVYSRALLTALTLKPCKCIIAIRHPADQVTSWSNEVSIRQHKKPKANFTSHARESEAIDIDDSSEIGSLGTITQRWVDALGHENILIISIEEMEVNHETLSKRIENFLTIRPPKGKIPKHNKFREERWPLVTGRLRRSKVKNIVNHIASLSPRTEITRRFIRERVIYKTIPKPLPLREAVEQFSSEERLLNKLLMDNKKVWGIRS